MYTIPTNDITQRVFHLNNQSCLIILAYHIEEKVYICTKIIDTISGVELYITEDIIVEILRECRNFWKVDITYPCENLEKRVYVREECGSFLIKFQNKKIVLLWDAIIELENKLSEILKTIRNLTVDHYLLIAQPSDKIPIKEK